MVDTHYPDWVERELGRVEGLKAQSAGAAAQQHRHAVAAYFDGVRGRILLELDNGAEFSFPPALAMGLADATPAQLADIVLSPLGTGLHWPQLDVDLTVDGLLHGVFGSRSWMRSHAARAGAVRSPAKASAARVNGAKGGRPRKVQLAI
jgi:Protein of unknown function (DUF2442)